MSASEGRSRLGGSPWAVGSPDRVHINCGDFKVGFDVGSVANAKWLAEFDWLFGARDDAVHHSEELRPIVPQRQTAETVVWSAPEARTFQADEATRAANFSREVLTTCLRNPKPPLVEWVSQINEGVLEALQAG